MKKVVCGISLLVAAVPAIAETGFYGELLLGRMESDVTATVSGTVRDEPFSVSDSHSFGSTTAIGFGGGYQISNYVGIDARYINNGEATDEYIDEFDDTINNSIESKSLTIGVKGVYPFSKSFSVNARLGLARWDLDAVSTDSSIPDEAFTASESGNDFYYGVGADYAISEKITLGLEYSSITMQWQDEAVNEFGTFNTDTEYTVSGFSLVGRMHF